MNPNPVERARAAKRRATRLFGDMEQIAGIGITKVGSGYGVKINLREQLPATVKLPASINGVPLVVEVVGPIRGL
jgi:hypothetical protein